MLVPFKNVRVSAVKQITECFRGRHRGGGNFTSFLRFSGPFFHVSEMSLFSLKTCIPLKACYRSLSGPSGPKCPRSVPESVPENGGVRGSVRRVVPGAQRALGTPVGHCLGHPPFSGTLSGTLPGHFGPEGPERLL